MEGLDLAGMFVMGLFGTGHCLGMCGPLVLAFPGRSGRLASHIAYHLGRAATYVTVGALLGGAGELLALTLGWTTRAAAAPFMIAVQIFAAGFLLLFGLNRLGLVAEPRLFARIRPERLPGFRAARDGAAAGDGGARRFFWIGAALGLIPCGLSYGAFARALATGSLLEGALLTLAFAAGTVPGLLLLGTGAKLFFARHRRPAELVAGMLMLWMAGQLMLRVWRML